MTDENSSDEHEEKLNFFDKIDDDSEMDGSDNDDIDFDEETAVFSGRLSTFLFSYLTAIYARVK